MNGCRRSIVAILALGVSAAVAAEVTGTRKATSAKVGITVVAGQVELPASGRWWVREPDPGSSPLNQLCLVPEHPETLAPEEGRRMRKAQRQQMRQRAMYPLNQLRWACADYALSHQGVGPATLAELRGEAPTPGTHPDPQAMQRKAMLDGLERCPWDGEPRLPPPYYFLIPKVPMTGTAAWRPGATGASDLPANPVVPQALELHPYEADGKHWVLFSDGQVRRVPIDAELARKHNLTITPVLAPEPAVSTATTSGTVAYRLSGLVRDPAATRAELTLTDGATDRTLACSWELASATAVTGTEADEVLRAWARMRQGRWSGLSSMVGSPVLSAWTAISEAQFSPPAAPTPPGAGAEPVRRWGEDRARQAQTASTFQLFGGQAAVRETLQLEAARMTQGAAPAVTRIPLAQIQGVTVKAHPFQEMLGGKAGGRLPLADSVPADRFFAYWAKPATMLGYLGDGSGFLARIGSLSAGSCANYGLKQRYLARLGMDETWLKPVLEANLITEMGLVLPDLFLIEGTDVTVLARVPTLLLFQPFLAKLGVAGLKEGAVVERALAAGGKAYWSCAGDLLLVSTCRSELEAVLAARTNQGRDSLGQSAEFRYMLTQLPLDARSRAYVYFSDPFIRRLVGPATKIGQLRRLTAAARLEMATAAALLYQLDGHSDGPTIDGLVRAGYLPASYADGDLTLKPDLSAESATYGSLARLATLAARPVEDATAEEADAYRSYVENYSRYWRQFFDPIAMRLDDAGEGRLELTTFILPLLDSSLYNGLRDALVTRERGTPLRVPALQPPAVVTLSLNLSEEPWTHLSSGMGEFLVRYTGLDSKLLDLFGPSVHLFIRDSDPIMAMGSGDLLGAFGGDQTRLLGGGREAMLVIPIALSVLTRPCVLCVELSDPDAAKAILLRGVSARRPGGRGFPEPQVALTKYPDRDAWLLSIGVGGVVNLRLGIEVAEGYLVVSNVPWSQPDQVSSRPPAELNGAVLEANPLAVEKQLPALFTAAAEQQRRAAMQGVGHLYPLVVGTACTPEAAATLHARLFGFTPVHPGPGRWVWRDGQLASDTYGSPGRGVQPSYKPGDRQFGLLRDLSSVRVCMQLEDTGLRSIVSWERPASAR